MRIRLFLMGMLGVIALTAIVTIVVVNLFSKNNKRSYKMGTKILALILALASGFAIFQMTHTFLQSKKPVKKTPQTVQVDGKTIKTMANSADRLVLPMAYDTIEATHPSVVDMPKEWHGFKYWMAVTAYPKGDATKENPHILVSNNLIDWNPPVGLTNPLDEVTSSEFEKNDRPKQYNSDTHLIYNKEQDRLEMFWRYVDDVNNTFSIYRMTSTDGSHWTDKEVAYTGDRTKEDWISPAFIKEDGTYKVWYVSRGFDIDYRESKDGLTWTKPKKLDVPYANTKEHLRHWHLDVQKIDGEYQMIVVGFNQIGDKPALSERHIMNLYFSKSKDNQTWEPLKPIIYPSQSKTLWDGKGIYRSAMIKENGKYYVFYSGIGWNDTRGVGIAYGPDIFNLKGLDYSNMSDFRK